MRWARFVAYIGEKRLPCSIFIGKRKGQTPFGTTRPRRKWEGTNKLDFRKLR